MRIGFAWALVLTGSVLWAEAPRVWTDASGRYRRQGAFETIREGSVVIIETESQKELRLPLDKLSEADLQHLLTLPAVAEGTLAACATLFVVGNDGKPVAVTAPPLAITAEVEEALGSYLYRIRCELGSIAVESTDANWMPGKAVGRLHVVKLPQVTVPAGSEEELAVYGIVKPLGKADLPALLASNRSELLSKLSVAVAAAPLAAPVAPPAPAMVAPAAPPAPVASANAAAPPLGAHFLDDEAHVQRYRDYRAMGWNEDRIRKAGLIHYDLDRLQAAQEHAHRHLGKMRADHPKRPAMEARAAAVAAQIADLERKLRKLRKGK